MPGVQYYDLIADQHIAHPTSLRTSVMSTAHTLPSVREGSGYGTFTACMPCSWDPPRVHHSASKEFHAQSFHSRYFDLSLKYSSLPIKAVTGLLSLGCRASPVTFKRTSGLAYYLLSNPMNPNVAQLCSVTLHSVLTITFPQRYYATLFPLCRTSAIITAHPFGPRSSSIHFHFRCFRSPYGS